MISIQGAVTVILYLVLLAIMAVMVVIAILLSLVGGQPVFRP